MLWNVRGTDQQAIAQVRSISIIPEIDEYLPDGLGGRLVRVLADALPDGAAEGIADASLGIDLMMYLAAFRLKRSKVGVEAWKTGLPRRRPAPGKQLDTDFYRRLLTNYELLIQEGYRDPAAELARRMGEKHSTVKSWLSRGRHYLKASEGGNT